MEFTLKKSEKCSDGKAVAKKMVKDAAKKKVAAPKKKSK